MPNIIKILKISKLEFKSTVSIANLFSFGLQNWKYIFISGLMGACISFYIANSIPNKFSANAKIYLGEDLLERLGSNRKIFDNKYIIEFVSLNAVSENNDLDACMFDSTVIDRTKWKKSIKMAEDYSEKNIIDIKITQAPSEMAITNCLNSIILLIDNYQQRIKLENMNSQKKLCENIFNNANQISTKTCEPGNFICQLKLFEEIKLLSACKKNVDNSLYIPTKLFFNSDDIKLVATTSASKIAFYGFL